MKIVKYEPKNDKEKTEVTLGEKTTKEEVKEVVKKTQKELKVCGCCWGDA